MIGNFDGNTFTPDDPNAPPSWADWEKISTPPIPGTTSQTPMDVASGLAGSATGNTPTKNLPNFGAEHNPFLRILTLRRYSDGLRMVQKPVQELERLRNKPLSFENANVKKPTRTSPQEMQTAKSTNLKSNCALSKRLRLASSTLEA